jgi:hypothetical protein
VGTRLRYFDGAQWIGGRIASLKPVVLQLDDATEIPATLETVNSAVAERLIQWD